MEDDDFPSRKSEQISYYQSTNLVSLSFFLNCVNADVDVGPIPKKEI